LYKKQFNSTIVLIKYAQNIFKFLFNLNSRKIKTQKDSFTADITTLSKSPNIVFHSSGCAGAVAGTWRII
jgi:hypothetical protein